ncbi:EH domain-binding protein isoform 5 [Schistosoma japonicum]|uniref:EH domain-binding protein isoform 5 n=1 Tax=Schistosoma japonicum TaxID=6182 RepID=A0A4Z2DVY7_SCHJA|nr:EH domain-binding protein isoform 5 [Schistosoma japonicum]
MSVWRRLQRVGKKAAKFQVTASLHELNIECSRHYIPGNLVVVWSRRSRRYSSKSFEPAKTSDNANSFKYVWPMPENVEFVTTLYRNEKAIQFEEKEWTCQIEDIGSKGMGVLSGSTLSIRRRVLATRQIDLAEFVSNLPIQTNLKIVMRLASKKLISATVLLTLNSVIIKAGEATDEDMISIASLMSLSRTGSFNAGSSVTINDFGGVAALLPVTTRTADKGVSDSYSFSNSSFHTDLSKLTAKLQALERRQINPLAESPIKTDTGVLNYNSELNNSEITISDSQNQASFPSTFDDMQEESAITSIGKIVPSPSESKSISNQSRYDLLVWCQSVTKSYDNIQIVDLTTSFQNGLAFCAILHHFFPDRIDYGSLSSNNSLQNCRLAFDVASKLGIPRVLDPSEVVSNSHSPDLLSMMTYLHQIRTLCCERTIANGANSACANDSSVFSEIIGQCFTKTNSSETNHSLHQVENLLGVNSNGAETNLIRDDKAVRSSPTKKGVLLMNYEHMLAKARSLLQQSRSNYLAPTSQPGALPPLAYPRKMRPISGSLTAIHSIDEHFGQNRIPERIMTTATGERKYQLYDPKMYTKCRKSQKTLHGFNSDGTICIPCTDTTLNSICKPFRFSTSNIIPTLSKPPESTAGVRLSPEQLKVRRLRLSQMSLFASGRGSGAPVPVRIDEGNKTDDHTHISTVNKNQGSSINSTSFNALLSVSNYISNEQAELEEEQKELDKEAAVLERRLRQQMTYEPGTALEEELFKRWFILVSKKNALIHRGFQLSIISMKISSAIQGVRIHG